MSATQLEPLLGQGPTHPMVTVTHKGLLQYAVLSDPTRELKQQNRNDLMSLELTLHMPW